MSPPAFLSSAAPNESFLLRQAKLEVPPRRGGAAVKSALLHRLSTTRKPLVLVTAPPGYGKSTLLAEWASRDRRRFAWLNADEGDNEPAVFLAYLAVAMSRAGCDCGPVFAALAAGQAEAAATSLLAETLAGVDEPVVIVVDDAQALTSEAARRIVVAVLDALPDGCELVLSGRRLSLLPHDWLASRYTMIDVGAAELQLGPEDASALLAAAGVELADGQVEELNHRVEGWPAALYLAALSLLSQRADGVRRPEFSAADRIVADYIRFEVLSDLTQDEVMLLRRTAFLEHVCGPIADALGETHDAAPKLDAIAQRTALVMPAEHECGIARGGRCFRLHNVLRELLAADLEREEPDVLERLSGEASRFYEEQHWTRGGSEVEIDRAIRYAWSARDDDRLLLLLETMEPRPCGERRLAAYRDVLKGLETQVVLGAHPTVAMLSARVHALLGEPEAADRSALITDAVMPPYAAAPACIAAIRAWLCRDGVDAMRAEAECAIRATEADEPWQATALVALGTSYLLAGNPLRAEKVFDRAAAAAATSGAADELAVALAQLALLALDGGEWGTADVLTRDALDTIREAGLADHLPSALVFAAAARVAAHAGDLLDAGRELERIRPFLPRLTWALPWLSAQVRLELARVHLAFGELNEAAVLTAEVTDLLRRGFDLGTITAACAALDEQLRVAREPIEGWASTLTSAERRLLPLLATHLTFREIATDLGISRNTVKTQAISVYRKLQVTSRTEAVQAAVELGFIDGARSLLPELVT